MRVDRLRSDFEIDIHWRHFPLHPETPDDGLALEELFAGRNIDISAVQARISRLMAAERLPYGERTMTYNSRLAQELGKWAETQPDGDKIHGALFRAYFAENVNLAKIDNLVEIAERAGLSGVEATRVLEDRQFREAVDADWQRSRALDITGVPAVVIGDQVLIGAQPYEQLEAFVSSTGVARRED